LCEPTCYSPEPTVVGIWPAATGLTVTNAYSYKAVDRTGQQRRGLQPAMSPAVARAALEARGLVVLALREADLRARAAPTPGSKSLGNRPRDVLEVTRALAALLPAGVSLSRALASAQEVAGGHVAAVFARGSATGREG